MDAIFNNAEATAPVAEPAAPAETNVRKEKVAAMKQSLRETVQTTPDFADKLRKWSDSIEVTHTLGFGKGGNIIVDKKATAANGGKRALKATSTICGYELKNIGSEPIEYQTEEFAQDETGKYVGTVVKKVWAPGETIYLTRQYTTMLCSIPEISFTLANGKIVASSKKSGKGGLKEELSSYYFSFNKAEDGTTPTVNDDEVKLSVDDADGKVKDEFVTVFGYLNNPKEGRAARAKGPKYTTQDLAANYIHKLLMEEGI